MTVPSPCIGARRQDSGRFDIQVDDGVVSGAPTHHDHRFGAVGVEDVTEEPAGLGERRDLVVEA